VLVVDLVLKKKTGARVSGGGVDNDEAVNSASDSRVEPVFTSPTYSYTIAQ
jgi:hypothetical protein